MKSRSLATLNINGQTYSIRATAHALQRMEQRQIDEYVVSGNILALGKTRLQELQTQEEEAIIIDEKTETSVVIGFKGNCITVITAINKANVFVKTGTTIEKLSSKRA